jgi:hypothetical protein
MKKGELSGCSNSAEFHFLYFFIHVVAYIYRMSQEERSIFWEVIVSAILSKTMYMYIYPIPNGFRDRDGVTTIKPEHQTNGNAAPYIRKSLRLENTQGSLQPRKTGEVLCWLGQ